MSINTRQMKLLLFIIFSVLAIGAMWNTYTLNIISSKMKPILCSVWTQGNLSTQISAAGGDVAGQITRNKPLKTICNVVAYHPLPNTTLTCYFLKTIPSPQICAYRNLKQDRAVSASIAKGIPWEKNLFDLFHLFLQRHPHFGVLDIGANLGQYSIIAALRGHQVIAVEAYKPNLDKLIHSIVRNNATAQIKLVFNAVADTRRVAKMKTNNINQGGTRVEDMVPVGEEGAGDYQIQTILMDDLIDLVTFKQAVMKMDIEGYEARALRHAEKLMDRVYIAYILMEWVLMKRSPPDTLVFMLDMLAKRNYTPLTVAGQPLKKASPSNKWPENVIWKHADAQGW